MVVFGVSILLLISGLASSGAQPSVCEALVQETFAALETACADAPGSSACFGRAAAATLADGSAASFGQPGDLLALADVQAIQTQPLDAAGGEWGLALLNVHANVPRGLSEQGLRFVMLGEARLENVVDGAAAFTPAEPLTITPLVAANLRAAPNLDGQVAANAPVGTQLLADGLSPDGQWVRVMKDGQVAWVSRQIVTASDGDIESLPRIGANARTPMQAFVLHTGADAADCAEAPPSLLVIQSPGGVAASITVNGVDIRFDSAIALRAPDGTLQVIALGGSTAVDRIPVPAGFTLDVPLGEGNRAPAGPATGLRPISGGERDALNRVAGGLPESLLYSPLSVPTAAQVAEVLAAIRSGGGAASGGGQQAITAAGLDCSRFQATAPLSGEVSGRTPFYWDAAQGVSGYRVNFFDANGRLVSSFNVSATSTTFAVDLDAAIGGENDFGWSVDALLDGQVACSTGSIFLSRQAQAQLAGDDGGAPPPQPTPTACTWNC